MIDEYDELDKAITTMRDEGRTDISETWKEDIENTKENLRKGARTALSRARKVLGAEVQCAPETSGVDADADEDMEGVELNYELPKRLRCAERGVKRMIKGIDDEDDQRPR